MRVVAGVLMVVWQAAVTLAGPGAVRALSAGGKRIWAVGDGSLILRSDDGGNSWHGVKCGVEAGFSGACFSDERTGYVFGGRCVPGHRGGATVGVVLHTADGGETLNLGFYERYARHDGAPIYVGYGIDSIDDFYRNVAFLLAGGSLSALAGSYPDSAEGAVVTQVGVAALESVQTGQAIELEPLAL